MKLHLLALALALLPAIGAAAPADLTVQSTGCRIRFDSQTGALRAVEDPRTGKVLFQGPESGGWWQLTFDDKSKLAADDPTVRFRSERQGNSLVLRYEAPAGGVAVTLTPNGDAVDARAHVRAQSKTVLAITLPRTNFQSASVRRFSYPLDLGVAFRRAFYEPQDGSHPSAWEHKLVGPQALTQLVGHPCKQLEDNPPARELRATPEGRQWLGEMADRVQGKLMVANRVPDGKPDVALLETQDGVFLPGYRLGGKGYLFRFAGKPKVEDKFLIDVAAQVTANAWNRRGTKAAGEYVAIVNLDRGPRSGGWTSLAVVEWVNGWTSSGALRRAGLPVRSLRTLPEMTAAIKDPRCFAIVNPYGELLPAPAAGRGAEILAGVRDFVRAGGVWWETGGYSFHYELLPKLYYHASGNYPDMFSDFVHLDSEVGAGAIYGVQPRPGDIFVPASLRTGAVEGSKPALGYYEHDFNTYVRPGQSWRSPVVRFETGKGMRVALNAYAAANGFRRGLNEKIKPAVLAKLKQSMLLKLGGGTFKEQAASLEKLPVPSLIHTSDYLRGGFDKQYPDHLPPHPSKGTGEDLRALYDRAHAVGHLMMPYTNPTWWCDDPPGPTFVKHGDAPLLRTLDGQKYKERYGNNFGWSICLFHPAVVEVNRLVRKQFTQDYPSDVILQDQVGARTWKYDMNPASPTPYAYTEGLLRQAEEDRQFAPLSTEDGWDQLINIETQFCGLTFSLVPTEGGPAWRTYLRERWSPDTWELYPTSLWLAHDKVLFAHHDLGQFVTNREVLAWTLAIGYQLSYRTTPGALLSKNENQWMHWLGRVQKSVVARYLGQPLHDFQHLAPGVMRAVYGPVTIVANTNPEPYRLSETVTLAGYGWYATAEGMRAGYVSRIDGKDCGGEGLGFVEERRGGQTEVWTYVPAGQSVSLGIAGAARVTAAGKPVPGARREGALLQWRTPLPVSTEGPFIPAAKRPNPPKLIGVINPVQPVKSLSWSNIAPETWIKALEQSDLVRKHGLSVVILGTPEGLAEALTTRASSFYAILNPMGETYLCAGPADAKPMLARIRAYVEGGGIWWEVGGYSFFGASWYDKASATWKRENVTSSGLDSFGVLINNLPVDEPAAPVRVTEAGREWLGAARAAAIEGEMTVVNRAPSRMVAAVSLVESANGRFVAGHRVGKGWLWRLGGFYPSEKVALPSVVGACEYLWDRTAQMPASLAPCLEHFVCRP